MQDFIGDYYLGDGLGVRWSLAIHSDLTFDLLRDTDVGPYDRFAGEIVIQNDRIQLIPSSQTTYVQNNASPLTPAGEVLVLRNWRLMRDETHTLIPVKWGPRRYLVFANRLAEFCEEESRDIQWNFDTYLRKDAGNLKASGKSTAPGGNVLCP